MKPSKAFKAKFDVNRLSSLPDDRKNFSHFLWMRGHELIRHRQD
jgi:hypothetical protein